MKKVVVVISILLSACGGAVTEARTDTAAADVDKAMPQSNTIIPESIDVRHKYSYVKLIEDGSKVAGLLELYGTNDYTQAVTINGYTQSGRGTFYVNGDKVTLSRTSGIAIDGVLDITMPKSKPTEQTVAVRPSPTESATLNSVGTIKKGNDGNNWEVKESSKGVKRWVKIK